MSLTRLETIACPYCMVANDIEVDEVNDIGQQQIVDCVICCQPIELYIISSQEGALEVIAKTDSE